MKLGDIVIFQQTDHSTEVVGQEPVVTFVEAPAMVTGVNGDIVTLTVFCQGSMEYRTNVEKYRDEHSEAPGAISWRPYGSPTPHRTKDHWTSSRVERRDVAPPVPSAEGQVQPTETEQLRERPVPVGPSAPKDKS